MNESTVTMTGGQFETSVVANEFHFQSFRQGNFGLGVGALQNFMVGWTALSIGWFRHSGA